MRLEPTARSLARRFLLAVGLTACGAGPHPVPAAGAASTRGAPVVLVGEVSRARVLAEAPGWAERFDEAGRTLDADAVRAWRGAPPGTHVEVVHGTWCGDSKREVARWWRALDLLASEGAVPFTFRETAVDRTKRDPAGHTATFDVRYVPTFIVRRDGAEVGRFVERAPEGLERGLGALLRGERTGVVSARPEFAP